MTQKQLGRSLLKKILRCGIEYLRHYLNGDATISSPALPEYPEFSYQWINNYLFPKLSKEGGESCRTNYLWGVLQGANLAKSLGLKQISVLEFGVAGGNGLVALEKIAETIEPIYDMAIDVYGFDTGNGLPILTDDYRDEPHVHQRGHYKMDVGKLQSRLKKANLIIGRIHETVDGFIKSNPSPIAFVAIDVDLYSSTMEAFRILDAPDEVLMPRIYFYFDDIMGLTKNEYAGERLAIAEFNASHDKKKLAQIFGLKHHFSETNRQRWWAERCFIAHNFHHKLYNQFDSLLWPTIDLTLKS
jgi:hypothetical protein